VCRFLEERGFAVESATNGVEALEILATLRPSVIITDLVMPAMHGGELIARLKSDPRTAEIPVVILSSKPRPDQPQQPDPRAHFIINKDIDIEQQLEKAIQAVCGD
jgi:CheY-like chemotaxis protein